MSSKNDEQLYLEATQEVDSKTQDPTLWAKAMALAEGAVTWHCGAEQGAREDLA